MSSISCCARLDNSSELSLAISKSIRRPIATRDVLGSGLSTTLPIRPCPCFCDVDNCLHGEQIVWLICRRIPTDVIKEVQAEPNAEGSYVSDLLKQRQLTLFCDTGPEPLRCMDLQHPPTRGEYIFACGNENIFFQDF